MDSKYKTSLAEEALRMANQDILDDLKFWGIMILSIGGLVGSIVGFLTVIFF